jgi:hypothetical protein
MKKLELNIIESSVLVQEFGQDIITLTVDLPSTHPKLGYPTYLEIKTQNGYGVDYCRNILKIEPKIINLRN